MQLFQGLAHFLQRGHPAFPNAHKHGFGLHVALRQHVPRLRHVQHAHCKVAVFGGAVRQRVNDGVGDGEVLTGGARVQVAHRHGHHQPFAAAFDFQVHAQRLSGTASRPRGLHRLRRGRAELIAAPCDQSHVVSSNGAAVGLKRVAVRHAFQLSRGVHKRSCFARHPIYRHEGRASRGRNRHVNVSGSSDSVATDGGHGGRCSSGGNSRGGSQFCFSVVCGGVRNSGDGDGTGTGTGTGTGIGYWSGGTRHGGASSRVVGGNVWLRRFTSQRVGDGHRVVQGFFQRNELGAQLAVDPEQLVASNNTHEQSGTRRRARLPPGTHHVAGLQHVVRRAAFNDLLHDQATVFVGRRPPNFSFCFVRQRKAFQLPKRFVLENGQEGATRDLHAALDEVQRTHHPVQRPEIPSPIPQKTYQAAT